MIDTKQFSMTRTTLFRVGLCMLISLSSLDARACSAPTNSFCVDFFRGEHMAGKVLASRKTPYIKYNWKHRSPARHVPHNHFSARWRGQFDFNGGSYEFRALADDGVRVLLDGKSVVERWKQGRASEIRAQVAPGAGTHLIEVEYFEAKGKASIEVDWKQLGNLATILNPSLPLINTPGQLSGVVQVFKQNDSDLCSKPVTINYSDISEDVFDQLAMCLPLDKHRALFFQPQDDSRLIYVSNSEGNDTIAKPYSKNEIADPRNPPNTIRPYKTISEALKQIRDHHPDWILLKKGDEWQLEKTIFLPSGLSRLAPLVFTSYGNSKARPTIKTGVQSGVTLTKGRSYVAVIGLSFYANYRDPESVDFVGWQSVGSSSAFASITNEIDDVEWIYLEDNVFDFFAVNVVFDGKRQHKNIILRRNVLLNSYSVNGHSQGLYANNTSMIISENIFDHNGWYQKNYDDLNSKENGQATFFNHNAYLADMFDTIIQSNIFSRASSIGLKLASNSSQDQRMNRINAKNLFILNNLFFEGEIGVSAGGNTDFNNGYRWQNIVLNKNIFVNIGQSQPTRRNLARHIDVDDWNGGLIRNNFLLCNMNGRITDVSGIAISGFSRDIAIDRNVINVDSSNAKLVAVSSQDAKPNIIENNSIYPEKTALKDVASFCSILTDDIVSGVSGLGISSSEVKIDNTNFMESKKIIDKVQDRLSFYFNLN